MAERYAPPFDVSTPFLGWSMSKAALNALIGERVRDRKLAVAGSALPEWQGSHDRRRDITLDQLLRMTSGLAFDETYSNNDSDVIQMLFVQGDMAGFATVKPLVHPPGSDWNYSSGPSLVLARLLRNSFASERDYLCFPRERLFDPLGMRSAVIEPDAGGTFVASSFMHASARDLARLALLFLQDGVWRGRRLLPEGWVAYTLTPAQPAPDARYGAHMWLKLPESQQLGEPPMPEDSYCMLGHEQQVVAIVPSRDLVIVRLGLTRDSGVSDPARDLAQIVNAFPMKSPR